MVIWDGEELSQRMVVKAGDALWGCGGVGFRKRAIVRGGDEFGGGGGAVAGGVGWAGTCASTECWGLTGAPAGMDAKMFDQRVPGGGVFTVKVSSWEECWRDWENAREVKKVDLREIHSAEALRPLVGTRVTLVGVWDGPGKYGPLVVDRVETRLAEVSIEPIPNDADLSALNGLVQARKNGDQESKSREYCVFFRGITGITMGIRIRRRGVITFGHRRWR